MLENIGSITEIIIIKLWSSNRSTRWGTSTSEGGERGDPVSCTVYLDQYLLVLQMSQQFNNFDHISISFDFPFCVLYYNVVLQRNKPKPCIVPSWGHHDSVLVMASNYLDIKAVQKSQRSGFRME
jgi:hypothetical protein